MIREYILMAILLTTPALACDYSFNQDGYKPNDTIVFNFNNCNESGLYSVDWVSIEGEILKSNSGNISVNNTEIYKPNKSVAGYINLQVPNRINDKIIFKADETGTGNYFAPLIVGGVIILAVVLLNQQAQVMRR